MLKKFIGIGTLAFVLFAFAVPGLHAQNKKQQAQLEEAIKAASAKNTKEMRDAIEVIKKVLGKLPDAKEKKPKSKMGKAFPFINSLYEFWVAADEYKKAKDDSGRSKATANLGVKMLDAIDQIADKKGNPMDVKIVTSLTMMGKFLINAATDRVNMLEWTTVVGTSDAPVNLTDTDKQDLGMHLYKNKISLQDISDVFYALDKLNTLK